MSIDCRWLRLARAVISQEVKHMNKGADSEPQEQLERCVACGKIVPISKDTPINLRKTYLSGAGQLCEECCLKCYGTNDLRQL